MQGAIQVLGFYLLNVTIFKYSLHKLSATILH